MTQMRVARFRTAQRAPDGDQARGRPHERPSDNAHFLPRRRIGWWALGLLALVALYPTYFGALENLLGDALSAVTTLVVLVAVGLGSVALFVTRDRSALLGAAYVVAVCLVLIGAMFAFTSYFVGL